MNLLFILVVELFTSKKSPEISRKKKKHGFKTDSQPFGSSEEAV